MSKATPKQQPTTAELCINTIRTLAMDAVQKANSGHPGAPMGLAPAGYALWTRVMKHNPKNPDWPDRDPLRPFRRPRLHVALQPFAPHRLRPEPGRNQKLPAVGQQNPRSPGIRTRTRRGNDNGPLGSGICQCRGHGHGRTAPGCQLQPTRPRNRRSLHLRDVRRRRPHGRSGLRSGISGRPPGTGQAHLPVRR